MIDEEQRQLGIFGFFEEVPDPRVERTRRHLLMDILIIALLTMICVGEGWEDMEEFGLAQQRWQKKSWPSYPESSQRFGVLKLSPMRRGAL